METKRTHPVMNGLHAAGRVHARHRGMAFFLRSLKWWVLALVLWMVSDVLLHFREPWRLTGVILLGVAALALVAVAGGIMAFFRPPLLRVARLLESRDPELGSKLVNFLQLEGETRNASLNELTRQLARRAVDNAGDTIRTDELPRHARDPELGRTFRMAALAPFALVLLTLFGGPHVLNEWARLLDPFGDHPPFSLTHLAILDPKEGAEVHYGASLVVQVKAQGHQPKEVFLTAVAADPAVPPVTLPMISRGDGTFVAALENIRHPLELTAHTAGNGTRSLRRKLGVILTPQIGVAKVRIAPPAYTGLPAREMPFRFAGLQALEGTEISFAVESNRPLGEGRLELQTAPDKSTALPLKPVAEKPETAVAAITAAESGKLTFRIIDVAGNAATVTPTSSLTVTRDQPPVVGLAVPEKDGFVVEGLKLPVTVDAGDDYGLRSVRLHVLVNGNPLALPPDAFEVPDKRHHQVLRSVDLAAQGAKPGDEITIFAEAIDTRPDPQISRSTTRRLGVITEAQYSEFLRRQSDVAIIAGKYENLQERLEQQIEAQREIENERRELAEKLKATPGDEALAKQLAETEALQDEVNQGLNQLADEMASFGRENPVYDFEKSLQEKLRERARDVRESVARNEAENPQAAGKADALAEAAKSHRERLEGGAKAMEREVIEPLAEMARLHELIKDFNRFKQLTERQKELAEQSKAYESKPELTPEDKLALRELGAEQRAQAPRLDDLANKLRQDAELARAEFPKAAASADELANAIQDGELPSQARSTAQKMLSGDGAGAHPGAQQIYERMDALFCEQCQNGQDSARGEMDRRLGLNRGMQPGNSFEQMMQSLNFRPGPSNGSGAGAGGMLATSATDGMAQVIGGESLMDGPISRSVSGPGDRGGAGTSGGPTARLDQVDPARRDHDFSSRTGTPTSGSILMEYEKIADAYFKSLTQPP